jgi:hypothetical protein
MGALHCAGFFRGSENEQKKKKENKQCREKEQKKIIKKTVPNRGADAEFLAC